MLNEFLQWRSMTNPFHPVEILLAEDNPGDVELVHEAFAESLLCNHIHCVGNGVELLDFFKSRNAYQMPMPDILLLDLNMPRMGGREALEILKDDPNLGALTIIVMVGSEAEKNMIKTAQLPVQGYIIKPVNFSRLMTALKALGPFGLSIVSRPGDKSREQAA